MWLQRVAITFQRYYKKKTDAAMLFDYVLRLAHSTEFFIQKGSGWALREYSKIDPQAVLDFVEKHDLPRLTRREAIPMAMELRVFPFPAAGRVFTSRTRPAARRS